MTGRERLAHRLLDAMEFDRRFDRRFDTLINDPALRAKRSPQMQQLLEERLAPKQSSASTARLREAVASHYAEHLTDEELNDIIAFFESAVGKKFVAIWQSDNSSITRVLADQRPDRTDDRH